MAESSVTEKRLIKKSTENLFSHILCDSEAFKNVDLKTQEKNFFFHSGLMKKRQRSRNMIRRKVWADDNKWGEI